MVTPGVTNWSYLFLFIIKVSHTHEVFNIFVKFFGEATPPISLSQYTVHSTYCTVLYCKKYKYSSPFSHQREPSTLPVNNMKTENNSSFYIIVYSSKVNGPWDKNAQSKHSSQRTLFSKANSILIRINWWSHPSVV